MNQQQIYVLCHPESMEIRYVGKSCHPTVRLAEHVRFVRTRKSAVGDWIKSLGGPPIMRVIEANPDDANAAERYWIAHLREAGVRLLNLTDGGDGMPPGFVMPAEQRAKIADALKGIPQGKRGPLSDEQKAKMSAALRGRRRAPFSLEHRARIGAARKGKQLGPQSPEHREKIAAALKGYRRTPEHTAKIVASKRKNRSVADEHLHLEK